MLPIVTAIKKCQRPNFAAGVVIKQTQVRFLDNQWRKDHQRTHLHSKADSHNGFIPVLPGRDFICSRRKSAAQAHSDEL